MTSSITAITAKIAKRHLAARLDLRLLRLPALLQVPCLVAVACCGALLALHAVFLQSRELIWLRASSQKLVLNDTLPESPFPDPQFADLRARWLGLQALSETDAADQIALLRDAQKSAARHVQLRPQWSHAWLNWARISAYLHPGGRSWQDAAQRAVVLGDDGWAFQSALAELMLHHESFMDSQIRAGIERSLLENAVTDLDLSRMLGRRGLFMAMCAEPSSVEAKEFCDRSADQY